MRCINYFQLANHNIPVGVLIYHYKDEEPGANFRDSEEAVQFHFDELKNRGFQFNSQALNSEGAFKGDNFGNYSLSLITLEDFTRLNADEMVAHIYNYLNDKPRKWGSERFKEDELNSFILNAIQLVKFCLRDPLYCYAFDIDAEDASEKRHPFYSMWDYFQSYLIFGNNQDLTECIYIQIGYD